MANRLLNEESLYLKKHAYDLVDWYPWGNEALNRAKKENKPIFLSIGSSSSHWCDVMQKESFENKEIAKKLNDNFICIKVDRDERVDIDKHFQEIYTKMNNKSTLLPLSIFMTSNLIPIYSTTYIPPIANYGMMSFNELVDLIVKSCKDNKETIEIKGEKLLEELKAKTKIEATKINDYIITNSIKQIKEVFDEKKGGFAKAPKLPHSYTLKLTINLYKLTKDKDLKNIVEFSLDNMLKGGMYDLVDSSFFRYSVDDDFFIPNFEKTTYDNALMSELLLKAYEITNKDIYKNVAFNIIDFMLEKMSSNNLFFSVSNAYVNGTEGEYFTYSYDKVKEAFEKNSIDKRVLKDLNIYKNGLFNGKNIIRVNDIKSLEKEEIKKSLKILKSLRKDKDYPLIDKKIITSWNAMMINSLFLASKFNKKYKNIAINSLNALENLMLDELFIYHSVSFGNKPKNRGFLEDYAWLIKAYISAYEASLDELYLIKATDLLNEAIKRFYELGRWKISDGEFKNFVDFVDNIYPSSASIMVENILDIRSLVDSIYEKFAFSSLEVASYNLMRQPISHPTLVNCAIRYLKDDIIIKSLKENLEKLINFNFKYPYTFLKVSSNENIEVCTNKTCFASYNSIDKLQKEF